MLMAQNILVDAKFDCCKSIPIKPVFETASAIEVIVSCYN